MLFCPIFETLKREEENAFVWILILHVAELQYMLLEEISDTYIHLYICCIYKHYVFICINIYHAP